MDSERDGIAKLFALLEKHGHEDPATVLEAIGELFDAFPVRDGSSWRTQAVYVKHLADLPTSAIQWICASAVRECKFLPKVAELREMVAKEGMRQNGVTGAEQAWERVMRMVGKHGTATRPDGGFGDPITDAIMTGPIWRQLGQTETDMLPSERKAFIEAYRAREANMRQAAQRGTLPALPSSHSAPARQLVDGLAQALTRKGEP